MLPFAVFLLLFDLQVDCAICLLSAAQNVGSPASFEKQSTTTCFRSPHVSGRACTRMFGQESKWLATWVMSRQQGSGTTTWVVTWVTNNLQTLTTNTQVSTTKSRKTSCEYVCSFSSPSRSPSSALLPFFGGGDHRKKLAPLF